MRMKLVTALLSVMTITGCAEREYIGNMSMGIPAPSCTGFKNPELNPACPEYVPLKRQPQTVNTVRRDPGMSAAQAYRINKQCFAGWSGLSELARRNGESRKQTLSLEAAEAALKRGISAGAADGISADQVRVDYEERAEITKRDQRAANHDFLLCALVYPPPKR